MGATLTGQSRNEIHPLLWRPETFGLTHQLSISNRTEVAQRKGTRKLTTNQSGITEECVLRGSSRGSRTYVLLILEISINNLSETDGHRATGRPCHWSPLRSCSRAEMISPSTGTRTLTCLIRHLSRNAGQGRMIPIGKYPLLNSTLFFIALTSRD